MSRRVTAALLGVTMAATAGAQAAARVYDGFLSLPSYAEGPPDVNPPFDVLQPPGRPNYPYTIRDQLTDRRAVRAWRAVFLENEYLKCSILPDLGGHVYGCTDKINGQEMFYANTAMKFSNIAYRGSWAAFGIEFNFPVSHNWMTTSPVEVTTRRQADGRASVFVANTDRVYGLRWVVELSLRPGRAALDQRVTLTNPSATRQRFYWWTNAAVRAFDDTQILYPMKYTASHGFTDVDTWPVDRRGTDNAVLRNHVHGPVSRFSHASREGYMAIWQPRTNSGVAHYAPPDELPAKKIWSWGVDADAMDWRRALSDDSSAYVEIQAGLLRDQETYAWLEPNDRIEFTETWLPLRGLGGVTRVTPRVAMHLFRQPGERGVLRLKLNVAEAFPDARLQVWSGSRTFSNQLLSLTPRTTVSLEWQIPEAVGPVTVTLLDRTGAVIIAQTEGRFDFTADSLVNVGPQPGPRGRPAAGASDGAWLSWGAEREVNGDLLGALDAYREGRRATPGSLPLYKAEGRLAVVLGREAEGLPLLDEYLGQVPSDHEAAYYRGLAHLHTGDLREARLSLEFARQHGPLRWAAERALARLESRSGRIAEAADRLARAALANHEVQLEASILLHAAGGARAGTATRLWREVLARDPSNLLARWEHRRAGGVDARLLGELAADPSRIVAIATRYLEYGLYRLATEVLEAPYPVATGFPEAGIPRPEADPIIGYLAWYAQAVRLTGVEGLQDAASRRPVRHAFPHGAIVRQVLDSAARSNPRDTSAQFLLGMIEMQRGDVAAAANRWQALRAAGVTFPSLHRNLGAATLLLGDTVRAEAVLEEGTRKEPGNPGLWSLADSVKQLRRAPAAARATLLDGYPDKPGMPTALVYRYARALAEAGRFDEAERLFGDRWFSRVEGGTNPRGVWMEVRTLRAQAASRAGRCDEARTIVRGLAAPVARLAFTTDGMAPFLTREPVRARVAEVTRTCP
jgi:tetratricopeptide (TPR) repeat protein